MPGSAIAERSPHAVLSQFDWYALRASGGNDGYPFDLPTGVEFDSELLAPLLKRSVQNELVELIVHTLRGPWSMLVSFEPRDGLPAARVALIDGEARVSAQLS